MLYPDQLGKLGEDHSYSSEFEMKLCFFSFDSFFVIYDLQPKNKIKLNLAMYRNWHVVPPLAQVCFIDLQRNSRDDSNSTIWSLGILNQGRHIGRSQDNFLLSVSASKKEHPLVVEYAQKFDTERGEFSTGSMEVDSELSSFMCELVPVDKIMPSSPVNWQWVRHTVCPSQTSKLVT